MLRRADTESRLAVRTRRGDGSAGAPVRGSRAVVVEPIYDLRRGSRVGCEGRQIRRLLCSGEWVSFRRGLDPKSVIVAAVHRGGSGGRSSARPHARAERAERGHLVGGGAREARNSGATVRKCSSREARAGLYEEGLLLIVGRGHRGLGHACCGRCCRCCCCLTALLEFAEV